MRGVKGSTPDCHCGKKGILRGMCPAHYQKWRYSTDPTFRKKKLVRGTRIYHATKGPIFAYTYTSPEGYTAYVGRGSMKRALSHQRISWWYESNMIFHTQQARNEWHAMQLEGKWGEKLQPRYNKDGYRDRPRNKFIHGELIKAE